MSTQSNAQELALAVPLIPILRGIQTHEAIPIAQALIDQGFTCIEVPLNSPEAFRTIETLRAAFPAICLGAGTVLETSHVETLAKLGVELIIAPNWNQEVLKLAIKLGMVAMPGVATPSEAFAAIAAGAKHLKAFPAEMISPVVLKAWRAVLPLTAKIYPVGGISAINMAPYLEAGAAGFGFGSSIYKPGDSATQVAAKALAIRKAWDAAHGRYQT